LKSTGITIGGFGCAGLTQLPRVGIHRQKKIFVET
jgi:hypothetical protein